LPDVGLSLKLCIVGNYSMIALDEVDLFCDPLSQTKPKVPRQQFLIGRYLSNTTFPFEDNLL
jgi:hypothetical protein